MNDNRTLRRFAAAALALSLTGCASLINQGHQQVSVLTTDPQRDYQTACTVTNDEGTVKTRPGVPFNVGRDKDAIKVTCESPVATGELASEPHATAWWLGNFLLFGIFAPPFILIDGLNSADWHYDTTLVVPMRPSRPQHSQMSKKR